MPEAASTPTFYVRSKSRFTRFEGFGEQSRTLRMAGAWKPWTHWRG